MGTTPNRQKRRADKKQGKRKGETYADQLTREKQIREAIDRTVRDESVAMQADQKRQILLWEAVEALNRAFGIGEKRAVLFMQTLDEVDEELRKMAKEDGRYVATDKLRKRASQITGMELKLVHEDSMRQARAENQAKGVYFPEDDPDVKEWW
jgi:hypothetical protein